MTYRFSKIPSWMTEANQVYKNEDERPFDLSIPGWMQPSELKVISHIAKHVPENGNILEIGSFLGRSTTAIARSAPASTSIHCIDLFPEKGGWFEAENPTIGPLGDLTKYNGSYEQTFLSHMESHKNITPIREAHMMTIGISVHSIWYSWMGIIRLPGLKRTSKLGCPG
jgi:hypothetical protein